MTAKVYALDGSEKRTIDLPEWVFGVRVNSASIHDAIRQELANRRLGTASTKERGEVKGSNRKPWRQKGTGRARAGDRRSPLWVGGGTIFGPRPRSYEIRIPRQVKRLAMRSILSLKVEQDRLRLLEDLQVSSGKTRELAAVLRSFGEPQRTVLVVRRGDELLRRAGRNIPWLEILSYRQLKAHSLFYGRRVLMEASAAQELGRFYPRRQGASVHVSEGGGEDGGQRPTAEGAGHGSEG